MYFHLDAHGIMACDGFLVSFLVSWAGCFLLMLVFVNMVL